MKGHGLLDLSASFSFILRFPSLMARSRDRSKGVVEVSVRCELGPRPSTVLKSPWLSTRASNHEIAIQDLYIILHNFIRTNQISQYKQCFKQADNKQLRLLAAQNRRKYHLSQLPSHVVRLVKGSAYMVCGRDDDRACRKPLLVFPMRD